MSTATIAKPATPNYSRMGTEDLRKRINSGKFVGPALKDMKAVLAKRDEKAKPKEEQKAAPKKVVAKKTAPAKPEKKTKVAVEKPAKVKIEKVKKDKGERVAPDPSSDYREGSIRLFIKQLVLPKTGKMCASTFKEVEAKVLVAFPTRKQLHRSEYAGVIKALEFEGHLEKTKSKPYEAGDAAK